jgi:hypothetical protein
MAMQVLQSKRSTDTVTYPIDFGSLLAPTETIVTPSASATVWSGTGAVPTVSTTVGTSPGAQAAVVFVKVAGGGAGTIYKLATTVTTSAGNAPSITAYVPVVDDPV